MTRRLLPGRRQAPGPAQTPVYAVHPNRSTTRDSRYPRAAAGDATTPVTVHRGPRRSGATPDGQPSTPVATTARGPGRTPDYAWHLPAPWAAALLAASAPRSRRRPRLVSRAPWDVPAGSVAGLPPGPPCHLASRNVRPSAPGPDGLRASMSGSAVAGLHSS